MDIYIYNLVWVFYGMTSALIPISVLRKTAPPASPSILIERVEFYPVDEAGHDFFMEGSNWEFLYILGNKLYNNIARGPFRIESLDGG
jgi:hypothetical protein